MKAVLLDTCAMMWMSVGRDLGSGAAAEIVKAALGDGVFVSPVSAWEIGLLAVRGRFGAIRTEPAAHQWFASFMSRSGINPAPFTAQTALQSALLPDLVHRDPADRFILATARLMGIPVVTSDGRMLDYAQRGHVRAIPC